MIKRKRIHEKHLVNLIANSKAQTLTEFCDAEFINCYAAARLLTYQDKHHQYYTPGMLYNLAFGSGNFLRSETSPSFIDECVRRDNLALNQPCTRVNFEDIDPNDGFHYFGITKFHLCPSKITEPSFNSLLKNVNDVKMMKSNWHFIFRLSTGNWLHKPNWEYPLEPIQWTDYGKRFFFDTQDPTFGIIVPAEVECFPNYFYRIDKDWSLSIDI